AHDVPLGCAPDEYDDLISGTCSHLPKLMSATHVWARSLNAPGLRLETQNVNVSACLFYRHYGFILGGYDRYLYNALPEKDEVALFWYYMLA
ncbi:hypothetical protein SJ089_22370, partial [Enterobacter hormaechei]|nr:hypothetical protein [Enterobacter hormaechei]